MTTIPNSGRPASVSGSCVVDIKRRKMDELRDLVDVPTNRSGVGSLAAGARMSNTSADPRLGNAVVAASATRDKQEATMTVHENACEAVAALYLRKEAAGLVDVKFFVDDAYKATREAVCKEILCLEAAIANNEFEPLVFNDRHH